MYTIIQVQVQPSCACLYNLKSALACTSDLSVSVSCIGFNSLTNILICLPPQVFNAYTKIFPTPPPSRHAKRASPRAATGQHDREDKHPTARRKLGETCTAPQKPA